MYKVKVSYLIALYNKEDYIEECINSILEEGSEDIEIEICIVDDGSNDRSLEIVKSNYDSNTHVKIANFNNNMGKNAAYNQAFLMSTGEFICIFGADDIVFPKRTSILLERAKLLKKSIYGGKVKLIEDKDTKDTILNNVKNNFKESKRVKLDFYENTMQNTLSGGCGFIYRKHANQIFPIPENLKFEDWWVSYHLLKNDWVVAYTNIVTIYRIHDSNDAASISDKYSTTKRDYLRHFEYLNEFQKISSSTEESKAIGKSLAIRESFFRNYKVSHLKYISVDKYSLRIMLFYLLGSKKICDIKENLDSLTKRIIN